MSTSEETPTCSYFISSNAHILVAVFSGALVKKNAEVIDQAATDLLGRPNAKWVVLSFQNVSAFDRVIVPSIAKLLKSLRDRNLTLRLCLLSPEARAFLDQQGLLRDEEVANDLPSALQDMKTARAA